MWPDTCTTESGRSVVGAKYGAYFHEELDFFTETGIRLGLAG